MMTDADEWARLLGLRLVQRGEKVVTAESCTGGLVAAAMTSVAGSSDWFERGFVTYSNASKREVLAVPQTVLDEHGAVSEACARAMAEGALAASRAQCALSITGIAGPGGGSAEKPVGTVCFAWAGKGWTTQSQTCLFEGDRAAVRHQSAAHALTGLLVRI